MGRIKTNVLKVMKIYVLFCIALTSLISCSQEKNNAVFVLADTHTSKDIFIASASDSLIVWAAEELSNDIKSITGTKPKIIKTSDYKKDGIYIGIANDELIQNLNADTDSVSGKWEAFSIQKNKNNLVIIGSDIRGAVYGVFELTERLGISPWQWWADVTPLKKNKLDIQLPKKGVVQSPSVQYRGIFLNDEDWGLQPWAAKTFEKEVGDIGPKTYEKIFQLLLRLKANTIWPAMHPCTQGFFTVAGNKEMAQKYHMVIGTSHAEPMLRNNVSEWNHDLGDYNYVTNKTQINSYWQSRLNEVHESNNKVIMTLGMRGIHDSGMEGIKSKKEGMELVEDIFANQRDMLTNTFKNPIENIPQVFIPYKEVLDLYDQGMKVPDDVTLMWTDDNYGYIRRLSNTEEQKRAGGSGVYYHLSYWGRPHDYLWLSTTQPGLIWFEMSRAYANGAKKIWIANVGDIKPSEYTMEFFLDLAWNINTVNHENSSKHLQEWAERDLGNKVAKETATIMEEYYRLAFLRKPEYMGWSQTEPTTPTKRSEFTTLEAQRRIASYNSLVKKVDSLAEYVPKERLAAWFQLVEYPVKAAANMNFKFLNHQLATDSKDAIKQNAYANLSSKAYRKIKELTAEYNKLEGAKWNHMMSMAPRNLPVFDSIVMPINKVNSSNSETVEDNRIYIQGSDFNTSQGYSEYSWKPVNGFGYSNSAITLFPLQTAKFNVEKPSVSYEFNAMETGDFQLELSFVPIHSNTLDHEITVELNGENKGVFELNTIGRSTEWKENVLRNSKRIEIPITIDANGKQRIKVYVNQTGIVLDQFAIAPLKNADFYEIPISEKK